MYRNIFNNCSAFHNALRMCISQQSPASVGSSNDTKELVSSSQTYASPFKTAPKYRGDITRSGIHVLLANKCQMQMFQCNSIDYESFSRMALESILKTIYPSPITSSILFMHKQSYPILSIKNSRSQTSSSSTPHSNEDFKLSLPILNPSKESAVAIHCSQSSSSKFSQSVNSKKDSWSTFSSFATDSQTTRSNIRFSFHKDNQRAASPSLVSRTISHTCHLENKKGCEAARQENWCLAVKHWTNAASLLNYPPAQFNLGVFYNTNYQENKLIADYELAKKWYQLAASAGHLEAKENAKNLTYQKLDHILLSEQKKNVQKRKKRSRSTPSRMNRSLGSLSRWSYPSLPMYHYSVSSGCPVSATGI